MEDIYFSFLTLKLVLGFTNANKISKKYKRQELAAADYRN